MALSLDISIHAPLAGRDLVVWIVCGTYSQFQSTRPLRGATLANSGAHARLLISIHAPLAGRDAGLYRVERPGAVISIHAPLAGRDAAVDYLFEYSLISIHAPLAGRDLV